MSLLLRLPNEILMEIGSYLDGDSLISYIESHPRISEICEKFLVNFRVRRLSASQVNFFSTHGVKIKHLDLSNSPTESAILESVIPHCESLRELSVINTRLPLKRIIALTQHLFDLEKLSLSIHYSDVRSREAAWYSVNTNVERLYIEMTNVLRTLPLMAELINHCRNLRWLHLSDFYDVYGISRRLPHNELVHGHIETVIISPGLEIYRMLRVIPEFFPEIQNHDFDHASLCYIESNGLNNSMKRWLGRNVPENLIKSTFLESWIVDCDITEVPGHGRRLECCLGNPKRLSILKRDLSPLNLELDESLAAHLVELNLSFVHWHAYANDVYRILSSATSLRALSLTSCTLMAGIANTSAIEEERPSVWYAMARLKLKELDVNGFACECHFHGMPSSNSDFDPTEEMNFVLHLEELNLQNTYLPTSFIRKLACVTLKQVKILVPEGDDLAKSDDLAYFLRYCRSLQTFKLSDRSTSTTEKLWGALADCPNLRELSLSGPPGEPFDVPLMLSRFRRMKKLEVLQMNSDYKPTVRPDFLEISGFTKYEDCRPGRRIYVLKELVGAQPESRIDYHFGRKAFNMKSYVGFLKPESWS